MSADRADRADADWDARVARAAALLDSWHDHDQPRDRDDWHAMVIVLADPDPTHVESIGR